MKASRKWPESQEWRVSEEVLPPGVRLLTIFPLAYEFRFQGLYIEPLDALVLDELTVAGHLAAMPYPVPAVLVAGRSSRYIVVPPNASIKVAVRNVLDRAVHAVLRLIAAEDIETYEFSEALGARYGRRQPS